MDVSDTETPHEQAAVLSRCALVCFICVPAPCAVMSHSWSDNPELKWKAMETYMQEFVAEHKRTPNLWIGAFSLLLIHSSVQSSCVRFSRQVLHQPERHRSEPPSSAVFLGRLQVAGGIRWQDLHKQTMVCA